MSKTKNLYVYHFCARTANDDVGNYSYIDGIGRVETPVRSLDDYIQFKKQIPHQNAEAETTIMSLSLLDVLVIPI